MSETSEKPQKKTTSRVEAGIVEEDFEQKPNDEALADGSWLSDEPIEEPAGISRVAGMSEEEAQMDMTPVVVGPPGYGSPDQVTTAGRLLPLSEHPFRPDALPEDHPARIDVQYGQGYEGDVPAESIGISFPGAPAGSDLARDSMGMGEENAPDYDSQTKADLLAEAQSRNLDVSTSNSKHEIVDALEADDASA